MQVNIKNHKIDYEGELFCKVTLRIAPVEHHYENDKGEPYIKYGCPICEAAGIRHSIYQGCRRCPVCGAYLLWEKAENDD